MKKTFVITGATKIVNDQEIIEVLKSYYGDSIYITITSDYPNKRNLLLNRLQEMLFETPIKNTNTLFTGHKDFICTYYIKENLSYKSQKSCVSMFFSNKQRQTGLISRLYEAVMERKRVYNLSDDSIVIAEIVGILKELEPELTKYY
jgi:hypothetical protein